MFGVMDFGIRKPANYEILESGPFEIWNTLSWSPNLVSGMRDVARGI